MNYDENPVIAGLRKAYWSPDEDGQQIWQTYKTEFAKRPANDRRADLRTVDGYLAEQTSVTKDHAAMLQMRREMEDIHTMLWRAGR
jgi:hypothetical protein